MAERIKYRWGVLFGGLALLLTPLGAAAAPGDIYQVTGETVNLRSGPSDQANIRSTVSRGDELIELRSDGAWIGVRVLDTGQEGWIFSDLVDKVASSNLSGGTADAGFSRLSPEFDSLMANINRQVGYRIVDRVEQVDGNRLLVTPTEEWLFNAGRDAKLMTTLAIYEMWKSYNNGRPVSVALVDRDGSELLGVEHAGASPELALGSMFAME